MKEIYKYLVIPINDYIILYEYIKNIFDKILIISHKSTFLGVDKLETLFNKMKSPGDYKAKFNKNLETRTKEIRRTDFK